VLIRAEGAELVLSPDHHQQILLRLEGSRPGVTKVNGVDVRYSVGWQTGSEFMGPTITSKVTSSH
jgi:hypothetical protein